MARDLPIRPFRRPYGLVGKQNGKLPDDVLVSIRPSGRLYRSAAAAWVLMRRAARKDGVTLRPTSTFDAYRPYTIQEAVFRQRYTRDKVSNSVRRWNGETWYLKPGLAPLATPGTSNHGWGCAVDVWNVGQNGRLEWLQANAIRYGFSWELLSEPWHLRYFLGDDLPAA